MKITAIPKIFKTRSERIVRKCIAFLMSLVDRRRKVFSIDQSQVYSMTFNEIIGAIFTRSQVIEQLMRQAIEKKDDFEVPSDFERKTFGGLLAIFSQLYPEIKISDPPGYPDLSLYGWLESAKKSRDSAAHGDFLGNFAISQLLHDYGTDLDRFIHKGMRKSLWGIDEALFRMIAFCQENCLLDD